MYYTLGANTMVTKEKKRKKGCEIMAEFIRTLLSGSSSPFSIAPTTDYHRHVPQSAKQLSEENWRQTGGSLQRAIKKVGAEFGKK